MVRAESSCCKGSGTDNGWGRKEGLGKVHDGGSVDLVGFSEAAFGARKISHLSGVEASNRALGFMGE